MIHCTLTQNKLRVEQDTDVLPFQYSNNINIQFIKDSTYENYVVTPYYAWVPTKSIPPRKLDAFALPLKDGVFTLPMNAFVKDGYLGVAFSLTDGNEVLQTDPVYLAVQSSVGSNNILPENDSWQLVVIDTVNSYIELNVNDKLQALIKEVAKLDENSAELQREVNELIDKVNKMLEDGDLIPEHKWENTFLHFKNPDGSWDNGVNLKGPSGVYFGNDTPPEDGEYNVWVLPDGTPDFEIYADQVKTEDGSNIQEKLSKSLYLKDFVITDNQNNQYGLVEKGTFDTQANSIGYYRKYGDGYYEAWGYHSLPAGTQLAILTLPFNYEINSANLQGVPTFNTERSMWLVMTKLQPNQLRIDRQGYANATSNMQNVYWRISGYIED